MIELLTGMAVIAIGYYSGFIVSRHTSVNRQRGDKNENGLRVLSQKQEARRQKLAKDPRMMRQIVLLYKSFILTLSCFVAAFVLWRLLDGFEPFFPYLLVATMLVIWFSHILMVEYLPRRFSRSEMSSTSLRFYWFVMIVVWALKPLISFYRQSVRGGGRNGEVTEEEKEEIVERAIESLAEQAGIDEAIIEEEEKEMIAHIFELDQTVVREIMIPRTQITAVELGSSLNEIKELVKEDGHSRFPVYSNTIDTITGILYVKDL